ncbi:MAG: SRPBCC domain-containing protein, partial [Fimbriimonadaceae bacterium]
LSQRITTTRERKMTSTNKLEVALVGETEIHMTRKFNFPKALVYNAFADHENHKHWLGSSFGTIVECYGKPEISAPWSFKTDMGEHGVHHMFGQCLEAIPNEKFVRTFIYNVPEIREYASVEVATFSEENGITDLKVVVKHLCKEARDGHANSGMEQGAASSYDALERYLGEQES